MRQSRQLTSTSLQVLSADEKTGLNGFTRHWDDCTGTPFLFNPITKVFITYDDSQSIALKAVSFRLLKVLPPSAHDATRLTQAFAVEKGLAGLFIFDSVGFTSSVYASMKSGLGLASDSTTATSRASKASSRVDTVVTKIATIQSPISNFID